MGAVHGTLQSMNPWAVTPAQLETYRQLTEDHFSERELRHMFKQFHRATGSVGTMGPEAFKSYVDGQGMFRRVEQGESFAHLFRGYDSDRDGRITFEEFLDFHVTVLHPTPDKLLDLVMRLYDADGTGKLTHRGMVEVITSSTHWLGYCDVEAKEVVQAIEQTVTQIVRCADIDRDGMLSRDDLEEAGAHIPDLLRKLLELA